MTDLIVMTKGADTTQVHRSCVDDHKRCGWVVSPDQTTPPAETTPVKPKRAKAQE